MRVRALFPLFLLLLAGGCTRYDFIVRTENAPLYADEARTRILTRMKRLDAGRIGYSAPDEDPVEVEYLGFEGYANLSDIRVFSYPARSGYERWRATEWNRREVVLEGKDWPESVKDAIRWNRIENGMTREMVEIAWGRPSQRRKLEPEGEEWTWEITEYDVYDDVHWAYYGGFTHAYYAYPWGWGFGYTFPVWEPVHYHHYVPRVRTKRATFDAAGIVVGWDEGR